MQEASGSFVVVPRLNSHSSSTTTGAHVETGGLPPVERKVACPFKRAPDWMFPQLTEASTLICESSRGPRC